MTAIKDDYYHVGLTDEQVRKSRDEHGVNLLTPPKRPSLWKLYLEKFEDPVVRVLLVAALFSLIISIVENEYAETIGIIVAILLATGIGFFFEYDAGKKFDLLNAVNEETLVKVIRNGHVQEIPRKDVVVGDIVVLETGEEVPADGELLEAISLQVNESNLTGEPVVTKTTVEADFDEEATYASNRILRGTTVVDGHGTMRVEAVGDATEIGKVARQSTEQNTEPTPLNIQLTKLANLIGKIGFSVAGLAFLIFFVKDVVLVYDFSSFHTFRDWLPALQATLQYFMMAVTLIVVAVPEGLPMSVTLSLALNMEEEVTGEKPKGVGNPTEVALLLWLNSQGCDYLALREKATVIDQLTFSTERKFMATLVQSPLIGKKVLYVKGAPEIVLGKCKDVMLDGKRVDAVEYRSTVEAQLLNYQNMAMRTLGFAFKIVDDAEASDCVSLVAENDLSFLGVVAISDPIRPDVPAAVAKCQSAGIGVKIVTGDTPGTATEIARQIGLWKPEDTEKNRSVAKEASDITLLDDSFNSIGTAVMWGRSLYKNIQRFIVFQLTINFVALFIVLLGSLVGTTLPLTVTQMLWVNLIMDTFAALALASIPPSESVMKEKPRKSTDFIITKSMRYYILGMGSAFLVLLMGMLFWFNSEEGGMTTYRLTVFFTFFVMLQFWNLFNARVFGTSDSAFKGISKSYGMELIILAILGGQILIVQFGGAVFRTVPLDFMTWMTIVVSTSFVLWIGELVRLIRRLTQK